MNQDQAEARVEQIINGTVAELEPSPRLELYGPGSTPYPCLDPTDGGSAERIVISHTYWLRDVPKERNNDIARQVQRHWEQEGHLVTGTDGWDQQEPNVHGRTRPDDFIIALQSSSKGSLSIVATSPCIWPSGTPR